MNYVERFRELTYRECEVLVLYCQGLTYREIGDRLFIGVPGVKSHMHNIYTKLGLLGESARTRAFALREDYLPLAQSRLDKKLVSESEESNPEPEIIEPIPSEVEEIIDQDQAKMRALAVPEPMKLVPPPKPPRPRRRRLSCFSLVLILFVIGAVAFWYFDGLAAVQGVLANVSMFPSQDPFDAAWGAAFNTDAPNEVAGSGQSPTLRPTTAPTATKIPTRTAIPLPTQTPTTRPSPTADFGQVYEIGEWHKEGNIWTRVFECRIEYDGIYILVEMWNQTDQTKYFHWTTYQNTSIRDNLGNRYDLVSWIDQKEDDEIVPAQTKLFIGADPYDNMTAVFKPDNLFLPGVTDIYFTLEYFSDIEKASWHYTVGG